MAELTAKVKIRAEDRFSGVASKVSAAGGKLAGSFDQVGRELADLDRRGAAAKRLETLGARLGKTGQAMDAARRKTAELGRQIAAAGDPAAKKLQREFDAARRKSDALKRSHRQQRDEVRSLGEQLRSAGIDTRRLGDAQRGIAADMDRATRKMERMAEAADQVSAAQKRLDRSSERASRGALIAGELRTFGRGTLNLLADPLERVRELSAARGSLARLGMERAGIDAVAARGRALAVDVAGIDPAAFVRSAYDIRSGIEALDAGGVADFTELSAIAARATEASAEEMTGLFATGYGMFKRTLFADATDRQFGETFAAQLARSVQAFKTNGSKMQQAIQSAGASMANAGVSMESQFAALGMLQSKMEAGEAGTALKALAANAAKADEHFREQGLGVRTLDARGNVLPLADLLEQVQREFRGMGASERGEELRQAFGSEEAVRFFDSLWGQADALRAAEADIRSAGERGAQAVRDAVDAADEGNIDARLAKIEARWNEVGLKIGEALVPALETAAPAIEWLAEKISAFAEENPKWTQALVGVAGVVGGLAIVGGTAMTAVLNLALAVDWLGRRAAANRAEMLAGGIGGPGPGKAGRGGFRGLGGKVRDLGKGGFRGLAGKIGEFGRGRGRQALGMLKGKAGIAGALIGAAAIGGTLLDKELSAREKAAEATKEAGGIGGAMAGAALGAALGSVVPLVGTVIGGLIGSVAGGLAGGKIGSFAGQAFHDPALAGKIENAGVEEPGKPAARQLGGRRAPRLATAAAGAALAVPLAAAGIPASAPDATSGSPPTAAAEPALAVPLAAAGIPASAPDATSGSPPTAAAEPALAVPLAAAETPASAPDATPEPPAPAAAESRAEPSGARRAEPPPPSVTWNVRISIQQLPGESAEELADRVIEKLEDAQRQGRLEALYDAG